MPKNIYEGMTPKFCKVCFEMFVDMCPRCNRNSHDMTPMEYREILKMQLEYIQKYKEGGRQ